MSWGGSCVVLGSSFCGLKRLRGVMATRPLTFSLMARKSRKLSPCEIARTCCSSLRSTASRASTMMLFTPSWSMKLIISFCAPAVMESIATTAPTPKIMPSIVSRLRSLCARRLESPMNNSGKTLPIDGILLSSPTAGRHAAHGVAAPAFLGFFLLAALLCERVRERDHFIRPHAARKHHGGLAAFGDFDGTRLEIGPLLNVDHRLTVLLEDRLDGHV